MAEVLRIAFKLSDVNEKFKWYSLQVPELTTVQPRVGHALVSLSPGKVLMIGGGNHNGALNEILSINLEPVTSDDKRVVEHPASQCFPARYEFACAKDHKSNCAWIFGGADTDSTFNDVIKVSEESVEILECPPDSGEVPCPRTQGNNSALIEHREKLFLAIFAGGLKGEQPVQDRDLHMFDVVDHKWQKINVQLDEKMVKNLPFGCQPPTVQGHCMTAIGSKIFVHGGINNTTLYDGFHWIDLKNENLEHDKSTYCWIDSSVGDIMLSNKPTGRAAHGLARLSDVQQGSSLFYVLGGIGEKGTCNDLWCFNTDSMSWTQIFKNQDKESATFYPVPRLDFAMCAIGSHDETSDSDSCTSSSVYLMIHGGMSREGEIFNDAWIMKVQ